MSCEKVNLVCENDDEEERKELSDIKFISSNKKKPKNFRRREESDEDTKILSQPEVKSDLKPLVLQKGNSLIEFKYTKAKPSISYAENIKKKDTEKKKLPSKHKDHKDKHTRSKKSLDAKLEKDINYEKIDDDNNMKTEECCKQRISSGFHQLSTIPVVESPPKSPVISQSSFMHFDMQPASKKNICSFLSDLESDDFKDDMDSYITSITNDEIEPFEHKVNFSIKHNQIEIEKDHIILDSNDDSSDSSDYSSTTSSSTSSSSSSSFNENSDESSNDGFSSGFGRFDSSTMQALNTSIHFTPIARSTLQIQSPFATTAATTSTSTPLKSNLFTPATCISHQVQLKSGTNFPIPFKIYSLRDLKTNPISFPSTSYVAPEVPNILVKQNIETKSASVKIDLKNDQKKDRSLLSIDRKHEVSHRKDERKKSSLKQKSTSSVSLHRERKHSSRREESNRESRHIESFNKRKRSRSPKKEMSFGSSYSPKMKYSKFSSSQRGETNQPSTSLKRSTKRNSDERHDKFVSNDNLREEKSERAPSYYPQGYNDTFENEYFTHHVDHEQMYSDFSTTSQYFINNSNLVEISTHQKRERFRIESIQKTVQVGNVLEIVPSSEFNILPPSEPNLNSLCEIKLKRNTLREKKRNEKSKRKEILRKEIQKLLDAGINFEDSDEEFLLEPINIDMASSKSILKKSKSVISKNNRVKFGDGLFPFESSELEENEELENVLKRKIVRRRTCQRQVLKMRSLNCDSTPKFANKNFPNSPSPPNENPPMHLKQPKLKKITPDLFASFSINPEPIYFYLQKIQTNGFLTNKKRYELNV